MLTIMKEYEQQNEKICFSFSFQLVEFNSEPQRTKTQLDKIEHDW